MEKEWTFERVTDSGERQVLLFLFITIAAAVRWQTQYTKLAAICFVAVPWWTISIWTVSLEFAAQHPLVSANSLNSNNFNKFCVLVCDRMIHSSVYHRIFCTLQHGQVSWLKDLSIWERILHPLFFSFQVILSKFSYVKLNPYYRLFCEL